MPPLSPPPPLLPPPPPPPLRPPPSPPPVPPELSALAGAPRLYGRANVSLGTDSLPAPRSVSLAQRHTARLERRELRWSTGRQAGSAHA